MARLPLTRAALVAGALSFAFAAAPAPAPPQGPEARPSGAPAAKTPTTKEEALATLKEMSTTLSSAKTMRFKVQNLVPMKAPSGDWVTLSGGATVMRDGRNKLSAETSGDLFPFRLYFDGKTVTAFAAEKNMYAQQDSPGTIDDMLTRAAKRGELVFVFADLVSSDPYAAMTRGVQNAFVVGTSTIDGVETRHLLVHSKLVDWEIWIGTQDRLPRLVTITDTREARKPTQIVRLSDWALDASLPTDAFAFTAPTGATQVPFRDPRKAMAAGRRGAPAQRPTGGSP